MASETTGQVGQTSPSILEEHRPGSLQKTHERQHSKGKAGQVPHIVLCTLSSVQQVMSISLWTWRDDFLLQYGAQKLPYDAEPDVPDYFLAVSSDFLEFFFVTIMYKGIIA